MAGAPATARTSGSPAAAGKLDPTVEEVRGSIEYFLAYAQGAQLEGLALTGGAARGPGVAERFAKVLGMPVRPAVIGLEYDGAELDLGETQLKEATLRWGAAVGLALWGTRNDPALSLVPAEVKERQQYQRALAASAGGLAVVALC